MSYRSLSCDFVAVVVFVVVPVVLSGVLSVVVESVVESYESAIVCDLHKALQTGHSGVPMSSVQGVQSE